MTTLEDRANACAIRSLALIRPREGVDAAESFASLRAAIAEFAQDEVKRATDTNAAAAEFLRSHGQYLFEHACGGEPRCEIDLELEGRRWG